MTYKLFSSFNKRFKYILTVIDVFRKYELAVPIKDKSAASVIKAFEKVISDRSPKKLWVDEEKEFYNATFEKLLDKHKIDMYSTFNDILKRDIPLTGQKKSSILIK